MFKSKLYFPVVLAVMSVMQANAAADGILSVTSSGRTVTVTALTDNIIKVDNVPEGAAAAVSRTTVLPALPAPDVKMMSGQSGQVMMTASGVIVTLDSTGAVGITAGEGRSLSDSGVRVLRDGRQVMTLSTYGGEAFYGAGERGHSLDMTGDTLKMYNHATYGYGKGDSRISQMNITMPLAVSSRGYAILFDDYATAEMILSNPIEYISDSDEPVSYYFINGGGSVAGTVKELSSITGRQPLPPLWSLGYITSRYGYRTGKQALAVTDSLKRAGYPLDGIVLDLYWFGREEDMGYLDWDTNAFPEYRKMLAKLKKQGVNTIIITEPFVLRNGTGIDNFNELSSRGLFVNDSTGKTGEVTIWVGNGGLFDVTNPATRQWYADRYHKLTEDGVTGWWGDLGEPEVHPDSLVHYNGKTARQYHNLYGNDWASIISEMFADKYPDRRLMTLMRAGTVGLQRYSVFPWSGDVGRSWAGLQAQIPIMINTGLSGLGYMSHDVGGFAIDRSNPIDPEMYLRWMQLGLFTPTLRTHAQQYAEPYNYPEYADQLLSLVKARYRWLPYNYTLAYENASAGLPFVRPLNFYDHDNDVAGAVDDQYLWGRDVMVAPVLERGATSRTVVFPEGTWLDISNPSDIYTAGQTILYDAPVEKLPLFVRAGSFIPSATYKMENTLGYHTDNYTVDYYPVEGESDGMIFEDDLTTPSTLTDGRYTIVRFTGDATSSSITIGIAAEYGENAPVAKEKKLTFVIHNIGSVPDSVSVDGKKAKSRFDAAARTLTVELAWNPAATATISVVR